MNRDVIEDNVDNPFLLAYPPKKEDEIKGLDLLLSGDYDGIQLTFLTRIQCVLWNLKIKVSENLPDKNLKKLHTNSYSLNSGFRKAMKQWMNFATNALTVTRKIISLPLSVIDKNLTLQVFMNKTIPN